MSTLERLAVDHPYYCSDSNYYSNDGAQAWIEGEHDETD